MSSHVKNKDNLSPKAHLPSQPSEQKLFAKIAKTPLISRNRRKHYAQYQAQFSANSKQLLSEILINFIVTSFLKNKELNQCKL